jgi:hypothetical protein
MAFTQNFRITGAFGPQPLSTGGNQGISEVSSVQNYPLGTRVKAVDPVFGESEFVYAKGVASTILGDCVRLDGDGTTLRDTGTGMKGKIGVAMAALVANTYGWYCVKGRCLVAIFENCTALDAYFADATAGAVGVSVVATNHVLGMHHRISLLAGGSAIEGTAELTAAAQGSVYLSDPVVALAV